METMIERVAGAIGYALAVRGSDLPDEPLEAAARAAMEATRPSSDFLLVLIPHDDGGLEISVEEHATASEQQEALEAAKATGYWRDVVGLYRHSGGGPLDNKWWAGPSTIYARRFHRDRAALSPPPLPSTPE